MTRWTEMTWGQRKSWPPGISKNPMFVEKSSGIQTPTLEVQILCPMVVTHRIHGTGIFTYMKGEKWPHEQWEMYVHIPIPWILWVRNSFSINSIFSETFLGFGLGLPDPSPPSSLT